MKYNDIPILSKVYLLSDYLCILQYCKVDILSDRDM